MELTFGCCICAEGIDEEDSVDIVASPTQNREAWQQWWAHGRCFALLLHPQFRDFREEFEEIIPKDLYD